MSRMGLSLEAILSGVFSDTTNYVLQLFHGLIEQFEFTTQRQLNVQTDNRGEKCTTTLQQQQLFGNALDNFSF